MRGGVRGFDLGRGFTTASESTGTVGEHDDLCVTNDAVDKPVLISGTWNHTKRDVGGHGLRSGQRSSVTVTRESPSAASVSSVFNAQLASRHSIVVRLQ
jgi:hypothetical protein